MMASAVGIIGTNPLGPRLGQAYADGLTAQQQPVSKPPVSRSRTDPFSSPASDTHGSIYFRRYDAIWFGFRVPITCLLTHFRYLAEDDLPELNDRADG